MTLEHPAAYDIEHMDDTEIRGSLSSHSVGVLGLPTGNAPSLRPMSFWFDERSHLYLLFILGSGSRKTELSERADDARFLVYSTESPFILRSILLTGQLAPVPRPEQSTVWDSVTDAWRPDVFKRALEQEAVTLYRFTIVEQTGIESRGIPPGFEEELSDDAPEWN